MWRVGFFHLFKDSLWIRSEQLAFNDCSQFRRERAGKEYLAVALLECQRQRPPTGIALMDRCEGLVNVLGTAFISGWYAKGEEHGGSVADSDGGELAFSDFMST